MTAFPSEEARARILDHGAVDYWVKPVGVDQVVALLEEHFPQLVDYAFTAKMEDELDAIAAMIDRCNDLGLDTISMGNTLGCAMELAEKGLLEADLSFGEAGALLEFVGLGPAGGGPGDDAGLRGPKLPATALGRGEVALAALYPSVWSGT